MMETHTEVQWKLLSNTMPDDFYDGRLQVHHTLQIVSTAGRTLLPEKADDSHTNLEWIDSIEMLAGHLLTGEHPFRCALDIAALELAILDGNNDVQTRYPMQGKPLEEGYQWLQTQLNDRGAQPTALNRPDYKMPDHPVTSGAPVKVDNPEILSELSRWYANAHQILTRVMESANDASPVRCWPHHFDIATLLTIERDSADAATKTIGVGMTPGDGSYQEPYWYVSPWPYPDEWIEPDLEGLGIWHTEGWYGAVLPASRLEADASTETQAAQVGDFLRSAVSACRTIHREQT